EYLDLNLHSCLACIKNLIEKFLTDKKVENYKIMRNCIINNMYNICLIILDIHDTLSKNYDKLSCKNIILKSKEIYILVYLMKLMDCKYEGLEAFCFDIINDLELTPDNISIEEFISDNYSINDIVEYIESTNLIKVENFIPKSGMELSAHIRLI